jgi:hypothetical protein
MLQQREAPLSTFDGTLIDNMSLDTSPSEKTMDMGLTSASPSKGTFVERELVWDKNRHPKNSWKVIELSREERTLLVEPNDPSQDKRLE